MDERGTAPVTGGGTEGGSEGVTLSDAFHAAADQTNDANDHDELHAAGLILHLDLFLGDMEDGELLDQEYIRRWIGNLQRRHNIPQQPDRRL